MSDTEHPTDRPAEPAAEMDDPTYVEAVTDLLGALAYGELRAFTQLAKDSEYAPRLRQKAALARLAAQELNHFNLLAERLESLGVEPEAAMEPFVAAVDGFHERTRPSN
jgi:1,2-phenylacetyl-CoA epoxidase catalytic subunit